MENNDVRNLNRRTFIKNASLFAIALPALELGALAASGCGSQSLVTKAAFVNSSANIPWKVSLISANEPGEPLIISGTIYAPDGRTPLPGMNLWVYQTDATGHYSKLSESGGDNRNTRIHGLMRTNAEGRYVFRTIKPAPYPGYTNPAHIHAYVSGPGYPEYWIDSYLFEGDPFITQEVRAQHSSEGSFASILKLTRDADGVLKGVRDIKVERCSRNCTRR